MKYQFMEMQGDVNDIVPPPCLGPFPYSYSYELSITQSQGSSTIYFCYDKKDCTTRTLSTVIQMGSPEVLKQQCTFQPYQGLSAFGVTPLASAPSVQKEMKPQRVIGNTRLGIEPHTFSSFHVGTKDPLVWGMYCKQYNWPDGPDGRNFNSRGSLYYHNTWRNENETWLFIREIKNCPCYPACAACEELVDGTGAM